MGLLSMVPVFAVLMGLFGSAGALIGDGLGSWTVSAPGLMYMGMAAIFLVTGLRGARGRYR